MIDMISNLMKKISLLILFAFVFWSIKAEEVNGIFVKNNGDTLHQILKINETDLNNYLASNNLISKLKNVDEKKIAAKKYKYIFFKINNEDFKFYSINITENDWGESSTIKPQFYRLLNKIDSKIKLYEFYDISDVIGLGIVLANAVHKKVYRSYLLEKDNRYYIISQIGFKMDIKTFFSDKKDLTQKIQDNIYTYDDMELIIAEYNNWYSTK